MRGAKKKENSIPTTISLTPFVNIPKIVKFHIKEDQIYEMDVAFSYKEDDQQDRSRIKKIVDEKSNTQTPSSLVYIKASLYQKHENTLLHLKEINFSSKEKEINSWTGSAFFKEIDYFRLKEGFYELHLKDVSIEKILESENVQLKIVKAYRGK